MTLNPEQLIDLAQKAGANATEVYQSRSLSHPVYFEANRLKQLESNQSEGTALRLWRDGCPGLAVAYGDVDPDILVEKALTLSYLNPSETPELSEPRKAIYPNIGESLPVEKLVEIGKSAIAKIRDVYSDVICTADLSCEQENTLLVNSQGLYCEYTETSISYYLGVEWVRGEDFLGVYEGEYNISQINPDTVIKELLKRLYWAENNIETPLGKMPILFTPNAAPLLWGTVAGALNGKNILENSSPWNNKQGQAVISNCLNISQNPQQIPYICPFDDEGTPTQLLSLITQGTMQQIYCDRITGRALGINSSGNGFRPGLGRYPTPDLVNLIIEPGTGTLEELISQLDQGLLVDQILGGGADISGDFSINIDLGYRIEKGKIIGRVKDTMLSGNVYTALKQVIALGDDQRWNGSCFTPSLVVDSLSITG
jgi:PmbA protein